MTIAFNKAHRARNTLKFIERAYEDWQICGDGRFGLKCEELLESIIGCEKALLTTSCTHALEMGALLLDIAPGDEVIMPSFTFVSTANAFALRGAKPVFVDIRPDTLNIDETKIEEAITPRTKAIVVVHYAGVGCEMDSILELAKARGLPVIEDNAHGLFGKYRDRPLGSFGALATQSFHETKNITCGEGGALIVNDASFIDRARILREKGTNRSLFFEGKVDKYSWVDYGSSYVLSDILAAVLLAGLEEAEASQASRKRLWDIYAAELAEWSVQTGVRLPVVPDHVEQAYHMFYLLFPSAEDRSRNMRALQEKEITAVFHYLPLHQSDMAAKLGADGAICPVTERVSANLLRLPFYNFMTDADLETVIDAVKKLRC